jgi:hypothetical protein
MNEFEPLRSAPRKNAAVGGMMTQTNEKRRSARHALDLFVEEIAEQQSYLYPAVDLSVHGIYLFTEDGQRAFDSQHEMTLQFTLPGYSTIKTRGRIVHVDDYRGKIGLRVAFYDMQEEDRLCIEQFIGTNAGSEKALANVG